MIDKDLTPEERQLALAQVMEANKPQSTSQAMRDSMAQLAQAKEAVAHLQKQGVPPEQLQKYIIKMNEQEAELRNLMPHVQQMGKKDDEWT